jgi:hypothetical protein
MAALAPIERDLILAMAGALADHEPLSVPVTVPAPTHLAPRQKDRGEAGAPA